MLVPCAERTCEVAVSRCHYSEGALLPRGPFPGALLQGKEIKSEFPPLRVALEAQLYCDFPKKRFRALLFGIEPEREKIGIPEIEEKSDWLAG